MDATKNVYETLVQMHPDKVAKCTRTGSFSALFALLGLPREAHLMEDVLQYSRQIEAAKLTAPYLLSDYLCYIYDGTMSQLAKLCETTTERLEVAIYDGCYWHDGILLQPVQLGKPKEINGVDLTDFLMNCVSFEGGNAHTITLYNTYMLYTKGGGALRARFCGALGAEMAARKVEWKGAVRVGDKVTSGYKGISVVVPS